ncbi:protein kinase domain-containing protein, partial [Haematococcus lacustris]
MQAQQQANAIAIQRSRAADASRRQQAGLAQALSQKYHVTGRLESSDVVVDGFYDVLGDFPEVEDSAGGFPKLEELKKAVVIDHSEDSNLCAFEERAADVSAEVVSRGPAARIKALAQIVVDSMGGTYDCDDTLSHFWQAASAAEKAKKRSAVIALGNLSVGSIRHRALLFKLLADSLNIKSQLRKGPAAGGGDDLAVNVVNIDGKVTAAALLSYG